MLTLPSPLAEGRELKFLPCQKRQKDFGSPLAEGRELKYLVHDGADVGTLVAPRGGA